MRDNKKRYLARANYQVAKELINPFLGGPGHVDKKDIPERFFTEGKLSCPYCGCKKLFESGGFSSGDVEISTYLCYDCKRQFDVYHD
jgi:DNA-directed RNA polymerase subunit RPC12/RpoP